MHVLLHIDSDVAWREVVRSACENHGSIAYLGFPRVEEGLDACTKLNPDIVVVDAECIDHEGNALLEELFGSHLDGMILVLTSRCDDVILHLAKHPRCHGMIWKTPKCKTQLPEAINILLLRKKYFPDDVSELMKYRHAKANFYAKFLSNSELAIIPLFGHGLSNDEVSLFTGLSLSTVKWHKNKLFEKLGVENSMQLANWAKEMGFVVEMRPAPPCVWDGATPPSSVSDPGKSKKPG